MGYRKRVNQQQLETLAEKLARMAHPGDVIGLTGDLGAGKTTFVKAFGRGMGVEESITSPTFALVQEYQGRLPLYHMDAYRLTHAEEFLELGPEEYFHSNGVCLVEWADQVAEAMPQRCLWIALSWIDAHHRDIQIEARGGFDGRMMKELELI